MLSLGVGIKGLTRGIHGIHWDHGRGIIANLHERSCMVETTISACRRRRGFSSETNAMRRRYRFHLRKSSRDNAHAQSHSQLSLLPLLLLSTDVEQFG